MQSSIIVIGAGPAGCVAAGYLVKSGYRVLVIEKETFPRFVIGESLLPATMQHLDEAGLLQHIIDLPFQKKYGALFIDGERQCAFTFEEQFSSSWSWTWQVQRASFDNALVEAAQKQGVTFLFETEVTQLDFKSAQSPAIEIKIGTGERTIKNCAFVIDASGYGRVLPRLIDLSLPSEMPKRGSIFSHLEDKQRSAFDESRITIHNLNEDSWLWHIPFSDGTASIGIVSNQRRIEELAASNGAGFAKFITQFEPLKNRYTTDTFRFEPRSILGYSVGVKQMFGPGYVLCGNSTEFLDPIFSSGVALATASGLQAAKLVAKQLAGEEVNWQADYQDFMKSGLSVFKTYVNSWYTGELKTVFFSPTISAKIKGQICSVLAGHVWDLKNPFVKNHQRLLRTLAKVIQIETQKTVPEHHSSHFSIQ